MASKEMMGFFRAPWLSRLAIAVGVASSMVVVGVASQPPEGEELSSASKTGSGGPLGPLMRPGQSVTHLTPAGSPAQQPASQAAALPIWAVPITSLTATRERPIFLPSRRTARAELASVEPAVVSRATPRLSLVGAIAGLTDGIAIFLDETTKDIFRMKTGETHSGWTLQTVAKRQATLQNGGEVAILSIPTAAAK